MMELAFKQAKLAFKQNEIPVGCVIVDNNSKIISSQHNKTHNSKKILQHAEILAINESCEIKNQKFLENKTLAGAAGFEPTITGPKPDALPLGYAPPNGIDSIPNTAPQEKV